MTYLKRISLFALALLLALGVFFACDGEGNPSETEDGTDSGTVEGSDTVSGTEEPVEFYVEDDRVILKRYDAAGDMDQYLDNMARGLARSDMIPKEKIDGMLAKVEEMRALLTEG